MHSAPGLRILKFRVRKRQQTVGRPRCTHMERTFNQRNTLIVVGLLTLWRLYLSATLQLRDKNTLFLVCMGLPVIVFFGLSSLRRAAEANWPWRSMTFDIPSSSRGHQAVAIHGFMPAWIAASLRSSQ